jgi:hypothetical protein
LKLKLDDDEYTVSAIPPWLCHYASLIAELQKAKPSSIEELEKNRKDLQVCIGRILEETVEPEPAKAHVAKLWGIINNLTSRSYKEADEFFPAQEPRPNPESNLPGKEASNAPK